MDNRQQIITTSRHLFERVGIKSVTMDDISREMGMSKKTLYVHFPQKDDLVKAVLDDINNDVDMHMKAFFDNHPSVWTIIDTFLDRTRAVPDVRRIPPFVYDLNKYYPAIAREQNHHVEVKNVETMKSVLLQGIEEGAFRPQLDVELTACLFARLHSSSIEASVREESPEIPVKRLYDFAFDVLLRGIFSEEGLRKYEQLKS